MKRLTAFAAFVAAVLVHCGQYHALEVADGCACREGQYCKVAAGRSECAPLPTACGARPTCDCIGTPADACRDEDGRLTLLPPRTVSSCDACSGEELCIEGTSVAPFVCRVVPARCEPTATCDCILASHRAAEELTCDDRKGRIIARVSSR